MSADFVICKKDASVLAVIELDDATHDRADRQAADAKKSKALADAKIQLIRWQAKSLPSLEQIKETLDLQHTKPKVKAVSAQR
jgi:very-short-patch-repair endonuclease